jgi:hypothetical protein
MGFGFGNATAFMTTCSYTFNGGAQQTIAPCSRFVRLR